MSAGVGLVVEGRCHPCCDARDEMYERNIPTRLSYVMFSQGSGVMLLVASLSVTSTTPLLASFVCDDTPLLLHRGSGVVEHVGSRALRIGIDDVLVTVTHAVSGVVPRGIGVLGVVDFSRLGLRSGDRIGRRGGHRGTTPLLEIDVATAKRVSTAMALARRRAPGPAALAAASRFVDTLPSPRGLLTEEPSGNGHASALGLRQVHRVVPAVVAALGLDDARAAAEAAQPVIGLGPGLTPSGDDLLIGLTASLWAWCRTLARDFAAACAATAVDRTTRVSADLLAHAAEGRFAEPLLTLIRTLDDDDARASSAACESLLAVGATSGADLLAGVLTGARLLADDHRLENHAS